MQPGCGAPPPQVGMFPEGRSTIRGLALVVVVVPVVVVAAAVGEDVAAAAERLAELVQWGA